MAKQRIELEVDIPEGYEATGEYRIAEIGETFLDAYGKTMTRIMDASNSIPCIILRKKELTGWDWINSLPSTTVFKCIGYWPIAQVMENNVLIWTANEESMCGHINEFSDRTCKILYKPE